MARPAKVKLEFEGQVVVTGATTVNCEACGVAAENSEDITELFGWRRHRKRQGEVLAMKVCRDCRLKGAKATKLVLAPKKERKPLVVPKKAPTREASALHVHPEWTTVERESEIFEFGPMVVESTAANSELGQSLVPAIDPNYELGVEESIVLANMFACAENTWLWGPSGTGKTSCVKQMCAILNWPLFRLNLSGDISLDDVVGTTQVRTEASSGQAITEFAYGRMIQAMLHGGVLLLDEFSAASPHVLMALQEVLEPCTNPHEIWAAGKAHATYVCTANRGETIHASPRFRVVVCDNTNGQGDLSGRFAGTNVMNEATRSRFTQWHYKGFPPRAEWRRMLQRKSGVSREVASKIIEFAAKINEGSAALGAKVVTSEVVINPRDTLAIARLTAAYGDVGRALRVAKVNGMRPGTDDYQFLLDTVRNMFGSGK